MDTQLLISRVATGMERDPKVAAFCLAGSYGRGTEDQFSDLDFAAFVNAEDHASVASRWRQILGEIQPIVFWNQFGSRALVINAITEDWQRVDLAVHAPDDLAGRTKANIRPLFDRVRLFEGLPDGAAPSGPDPNKVRYIINEFMRVLGLAPVVIGRGEYFIAVMGAGLLRNLLSDLLVEMENAPERGGILHLSRALPPQGLDLLNRLPTPGAERHELLAADAEIARQFFPIARDAAERLNLDWPEDFEIATERHLQAQFGDEIDMRWR